MALWKRKKTPSGRLTQTPPLAVSGAPSIDAAGSQAAAPRYPWVSLHFTLAQWVAWLGGLAAGAGLVYLYRLYQQGSDVSPDSVYGYTFAVAGTALLLLVGAGYTLRKRLGNLRPGRLHAFLAWHMVGGVLGLGFILMHAAGNFNQRSGTYTLYGLLAIVVSGIIGRVLDRLSPRKAAAAALQSFFAAAQTPPDDAKEKPELLAEQDHHRSLALPQPDAYGTPWDLAYYHLDPEIDEIPSLLSQGVRGYSSPNLDMKELPEPVAARQARAAQPDIHQIRDNQAHGEPSRLIASSPEQFYLQLVRVWRRAHILLCLLTLGLLLWHLEYVATLLIPSK